MRIPLAVLLISCATACSPSPKANLRLVVAGPDASRAATDLSSWFRSSLAEVNNPASVFGFTCWGVNVMGEGISTSVPQVGFGGFTPAPGECTYFGETTALVPVPESGESRTFELRVTPGSNRLIQVFGVNTDFGCPDTQSFGSLLSSVIEQEGFDSPSVGAFASIGLAYSDLFSDTQIEIPGSYVATARANICGVDEGENDGFDPADLPGLWGWWKSEVVAQSDGSPVITWSDASGHGNSVSNVGGSPSPVFRTTLEFFPVIDFDGSDDYFERALPSGQPMGDGAFTMMAVFNTDVAAAPLTAANYDLVNFGYNATGQGAMLYFDGGGLHAAAVATSPTVSSAAPLTTNTWYVAAATYDGGGPTTGIWRLYLDGVLEDTQLEDALAPGFSSGAVRIAADMNGAGGRFDGRIADIVVYDRALSDAEIFNLTESFQSKYGLL